MKKQIASLLVISCLAAFSWAQGAKGELFDARKVQQELEIMKGILGTTLSFVAPEIQKAAGTTRATERLGSTYYTGSMFRTSAFYLYGQGAVFIIPASSLRLPFSSRSSRPYVSDLDGTLAQAEAVREYAVASARARTTTPFPQGVAGGIRGGVVGGVPGPAKAAAPPQPPTPPAPPAPPTPPQVNQEELRKKVAEAQDRVKKSREEMEANREKFMAALVQIKAYLIEALANHGDSLTTVKPNEYISLVITIDDFEGFSFADEGGSRGRQEIVSVQKSWITDYKTGKLTLDAFKLKALQYND